MQTKAMEIIENGCLHFHETLILRKRTIQGSDIQITLHCMIMTDTQYCTPLTLQWYIYHHNDFPKYKMSSINKIQQWASGKNAHGSALL